MKHLCVNFIFALFALIISFNVNASDEKLLLMTDERAPFEFANDKGEPDGIAVKVMQCTH